MNRGKNLASTRWGGYTIVETLIFLAVTGMMLASASVFIGGRQNKAQFVNSVRDFETKITDIANDVSTGYYQSRGTLGCSGSSTGPVPDYGSGTTLGSNNGCIFVGSVVKFGDSAKDKFVQFTLAGLRTVDGITGAPNVGSVIQAEPKVLNNSSYYTTNVFGYGTTVECITTTLPCNSTTHPNNAAIGFYTKFLGTNLSGGNGIQTDVWLYNSAVVPTVIPVNASATSSTVITALENVGSVPATSINPVTGVVICLRSGGTSQYALIRLGGFGNGLTVSSEIKNYSGTLTCDA